MISKQNEPTKRNRDRQSVRTIRVSDKVLKRLIGLMRSLAAFGGLNVLSYCQHLYLQGQQKGLNPEGQPIRQGFTREEVEAVLAARGRPSKASTR